MEHPLFLLLCFAIKPRVQWKSFLLLPSIASGNNRKECNGKQEYGLHKMLEPFAPYFEL